jgi:hypothetical protein
MAYNYGQVLRLCLKDNVCEYGLWIWFKDKAYGHGYIKCFKMVKVTFYG